MGFRFRRSLRLLPDLRINLGKRGASVSVGVRGAHVTVGPTGTRTTVGVPGTGLSYTRVDSPGRPPEATPAAPAGASRGWRVVAVLLLALACIAWFVATH